MTLHLYEMKQTKQKQQNVPKTSLPSKNSQTAFSWSIFALLILSIKNWWLLKRFQKEPKCSDC